MMIPMFTIIHTEPQNLVTKEEVRDFLKVSSSYDDQFLMYLAQSVIDFAESFTGICLNKKLIKCYVKLLRRNNLVLRYPPIIKINKIMYHKIGDPEIILDNYFLNKDTNELILLDQFFLDNLQIFYESGTDPAQLPISLKQGFLEHIAHIYDGTACDNILPNKVKYCYMNYRKWKI